MITRDRKMKNTMLLFLLLVVPALGFDETCVTDLLATPVFPHLMEMVDNATFASPEVCKEMCSKNKYLAAGINQAMYCYCSSEIPVLSASLACNITCLDSSICGGYESGDLTLYELSTSLSGSIIMSFVQNLSIIKCEELVTAVVIPSEGSFIINWDDGAPPEVNGTTHTYKLPGTYSIKASLLNINDVSTSMDVTVHDIPTIQANTCPYIVELGAMNSCGILFDRQGYDYQITWSLANDSSMETNVLNMPTEEIHTIGNNAMGVTPSSATLSMGELVILPNQNLDNGGYLARAIISPQTAGNIGVYVLTPTCSTGSYCGDFKMCASSCTSRTNPFTCSSSFCPARTACNSGYCSSLTSPLVSYTHTLITSFAAVDTEFIEDFWIPAGSMVAVGCANVADCPSVAVLSSRPVIDPEIPDIIFATASSTTSISSEKHLVQLVVREDKKVDIGIEFVCDSVAPIPNVEVTPAIHDASTVAYVNQSKLLLNYTINSPAAAQAAEFGTTILCQQKISNATYEPEVWMPYGTHYSHPLTFSQGSPLFSEVDIDSATYYNYYDDAINGYVMDLSLIYANEGLYFMRGNTSNMISWVNYEAIVHVVPKVTNTWVLDIICPCLDSNEGFPFILTFPSATNPPWNATFKTPFELGNVFPDELVDFVTFGANGVAASLLIDKIAVVLTTGVYTVNAFLENEISNTTITKTFTVEEAIRDVFCELTWNNSGIIMNGLGSDNTIFMANYDVFVVPTSRTGIPDFWRLWFNDTGDEIITTDAFENFTVAFPQDAKEVTIIIGGYNSVQGWVESPPIVLQIFYSIQGLFLEDTGTVTKPNEIRNLVCNFMVWTTMACVIIEYGEDPMYSEAYGNKEKCNETYPDVNYIRQSLSPIQLFHNYTKEGVYEVKALAIDGKEELTHSLSVLVGDCSCTIPEVLIINGNRIYSAGTDYYRAFDIMLDTEATYQCNGSFTYTKSWFISKVNESSGISLSDIVMENINTATSARLFLPGNFLEYGIYRATYTFIINIRDLFYLQATDYIYFNVIASPIMPIIMEGSPLRTSTGFGQIIILNAAELSKDPDDPDFKEFNVTWWCCQKSPNLEEIPSANGRLMRFNKHPIPLPTVAINSGLINGGCFGDGAGTLDAPGKIMFDTACFISAEGTFEFIAEVERDGRFAWTSVSIDVSKYPPPTMKIDCEESICYPVTNGLVIDSNIRLALRGSCTANCHDETKMMYKWAIKKYDEMGDSVNMSSDSCSAESSDENVLSMTSSACCPTFKTGLSSTDLGVCPSFFENNNNIDKYIIRLTGTIEELEGYTEILIIKNKPPVGGSCYVNKRIGDALLSKYTSACTGWLDPDKVGIASYKYYCYRNATDGLNEYLLATSISGKLDIVLPVGECDLRVDISDHLKAKTTFKLGIIDAAMPTKEQMNSYNSTSDMANLEDSGDISLLKMKLAAFSSVLENADWYKIDDAAIANLTDEELAKRIAYLSDANFDALERTIQSMSISTTDDLNGYSAILQQIFAGVFESELGALTYGLDTREIGMELLEKLADQVPNVKFRDPDEIKPYITNVMDAAAAMILTVNKVTAKEDPVGIPPKDFEAAEYLSYDTDISEDFVMSTDKDEQFTANVIVTTRQNSEAQIQKIFDIINKTAVAVYDKLLIGESVSTNSPNGASLMISKLTEELLEKGLTIEGAAENAARIIFPKLFCPSKYNTPNTKCREEFRLTTSVWPCITHLYPDSSKVLSIHTKIIDVNVDIRNERVNVENETDPILIQIPRVVPDVPVFLEVNSNSYEYGSLPLIYHWFNVTNPRSAFTLEIAPISMLPQCMIILIDYERMPTPSRHLKRLLVRNMPRNSNGTYSYFINSMENMNRIGRFFIGFGCLKSGIVLTQTTKLERQSFINDNLHYDFRVYTSGCYFFDKVTQSWSGSGMHDIEATYNFVKCTTKHMSIFGSGFLPTPNLIDFAYVFARYGLIDNVSIYCILILVTSTFILMMLWGHYMDRKDIVKKGVIPLPDNKPEDKYLYEVTFKTGPDKEASTDSKICFIASGDYGETDVRIMPNGHSFLFKRFSTNQFVMSVPAPLGHINYLRIFHDNSGEPPLDSWQLEMAVFRDLQTNEKSTFDTNAWLAFDRENGKIDKIFISLEGDEEKSFSQQMYVRGNKTMNEDHIWMSIFLRPALSRYGRKERVAVCASFLYLNLVVNALWYQTSADSPRDGYIDLGMLSISLDRMLVGVLVVVLVYPFVCILAFIFKRARPKNLKRCRALSSIEEQRREQLKEVGVTSTEELDHKCQVEIDEEKPTKPKEKSPIRCLPWWTRIAAWILILAIICGSTFIVWSFGIMWGEIKTVKFLSSFIFSFLISVVVTQWIKVLIFSLTASLCMKIDLTVEDADCDEELPALKQNEEWFHMRFMDPGMRKKVHRVEGVDSGDSKVEALRIRRMKEREMSLVLRGILVYCIFLAIIYILVDGRMDYNAFLMQDHLTKTFIKEKHLTLDYSKMIKTSSDWWMWSRKVIMQEIRAQRNYNNAPPYGLKGFLNDKTSRIMGYAIIRQIRSKRHNCEAPEPLNQLIDRCSGIRGLFQEDTKDFCAKWSNNETFAGSCNWDEFKYSTASELGTFSSTGRLGTYSGGGYVIRLSGPQNRILKRMLKLQQNFWIDQNTRAVILEFSVYNANVNLFSICTVMAEFLEGGGIIPRWRFEPIRLIKAEGIDGMVTTVAEILYCIAISFFTISELWTMKKMKMKYFEAYWNLAEICILLISYTTIGLYIYRSMLTKDALAIFNVTRGNGYVRMDSAAYVDQYFLYCMAMVIFFSTLKLIKLLQFNKRMNVLAKTIRICWDELKIFLVAFAIIFFAFACLFFFMFNSDLEDFSQILKALQTSFKMMMGKFDFEAMQRANSLSPLLFFVFSVMNSMILINIMLTIILQAFNIVKKDLAKQENRLDVVDFVWSQFKQFVRKESKPRIHVEPKLTDKRDLTGADTIDNTESDQLPDKVGQLVKYINDVYFDGRLDMTDSQAKKSLLQGKPHQRFANEDNFQKRKVHNSDA